MLEHHSTNELQIAFKALGYLRTHWWFFVLEILLIYGYALHKFHRTPNIYESDSTLLIDTSKRQMYQAVMSPGIQNVVPNSRKQNMVYLLTSGEVIERFRTQFTEFYNREGRPLHLRDLFPNGSSVSGDLLREWVVLNWDKNSDIYYIRCSAQNPDAAHDICLAYMNTVQAYYPEIGQREAVIKREFLSRQIASLIRQLAEREYNIAEFQKKNEEFMSFMMLNIRNNGLSNLRGRLLETRQSISANRAIKSVILRTPRTEGPDPEAWTATQNALEKRLVELRYKQHLTLQTNTPDKEQRLAEIQHEIDGTQTELIQVRGKAQSAFVKNPIPESSTRNKLTDLEVEYRMSLISIDSLEREIAQIDLKQQAYTQQRLEYDRLQAELDHKKRLLGNLYQKEQETELELSAGNAEIFRLQEPTRSTHRVSPQLSKTLFGSLSLCLFFVAVTTFLFLSLLPRIDNEAEVLRLNLPVLGKIPLLTGQYGNIEELSPFALEYLKIMNYRILRETKDQKCPVIIVSSPQAGEGKSTVTYFLNLASQSPNRKSLFIDGDMVTAHPNIFFGLREDHTAGLKAIIESGTNADHHSLIVKTNHDGIWFLPRGGKVETIASPVFLQPVTHLIENLRKEFDMIFIDTPPIFSSNLTHQWAGIADLIVLVARVYLTRPKDLVEALQTCKIFSKAPVGVALNCLPLAGQQRRASNYYFSRRRSIKLAA